MRRRIIRATQTTPTQTTGTPATTSTGPVGAVVHTVRGWLRGTPTPPPLTDSQMLDVLLETQGELHALVRDVSTTLDSLAVSVSDLATRRD